MSIRIRVVDGVTVALCAARSMPKEGDLYLDDAAHHALSVKFDQDFASEGIGVGIHDDAPEVPLMDREESNNPNRDEWERTFMAGTPEGKDGTG